MTRYFAFLRAINVGGRNVKMEILRQLFAGLGFTEIQTYIASGNVIFETSRTDRPALEKDISEFLNDSLGFEVAVFLRTLAEVNRITDDIPFSPERLVQAQALNVAFIHEPAGERQVVDLMDLRTDIDDFAVRGREIYWSCLKKQSESTFSNAVLEKVLGRPATMRGIRTVRKMAAKFG